MARRRLASRRKLRAAKDLAAADWQIYLVCAAALSAQALKRSVFGATSDEYERFRAFSYVYGMQSVSEMARAAIKMMFIMRCFNSFRIAVGMAVFSTLACAQQVDPPKTASPIQQTAANLSGSMTAHVSDGYVLGPGDTLNIHVVDMDELGEKPYPVDLAGNINLPRIGRVHATGLTVQQLETVLTERLRDYLRDPMVNVSVAEYHSQPVSVLGAVNNPGVHQIQGNKSLFEVISEAGGLRSDCGNSIDVTRRLVNGPLPLPNATIDPTGTFSIAELNIRSVMSAKNPQDNIPVKPNDVITVPKAELVYVIGSVKHPGGFPLQERPNLSVLEALSLAEGLDSTAAASRAKILRNTSTSQERVEIDVNVKRILAGKTNDVPLLADDILFIPTSTGKVASMRAIEALVQTGTGVMIYAHPF